MPEPEIRELRYFRAVAEELGITRAAERLGIAQPPLSRAMRRLERRLGVDLLDRTGHRLALTRAGESPPGGGGRRPRRPRRRGAPDAAGGPPRPGPRRHRQTGVSTRLLARICARFREDADAPPIRVVVSGFGEQADMVRDGRADVAIAACADARGLDVALLTSEPRLAALPANHRLAGREVLSTADLRDEPAPRWSDPRTVDQAHWLGHPDRPADGPIMHDSAQLLDVVALGQAVALIPVSLAALNLRPDVAYRPIPDAAPYKTLALWPAGSRSPSIARFLHTAHQEAT